MRNDTTLETFVQRASNKDLPATPQRLFRKLNLEKYWLSEPHTAPLFCLYELSESGLLVVLADQAALGEQLEAAAARLAPSMIALAEDLQLPLLYAGQPWQLIPLEIAKPWGKEIWFTGIEQRGVCAVRTATRDCPLPWAQCALPCLFTQNKEARPPLLLKILAPHASPVLGDLYFELHEEKQEVYVVTSIAEQAWPSAVGAIRIGFSAERRAEFSSENTFKQAYLDSVRAYAAVRREIDDWLDEHAAMSGDLVPAEAEQLARLQRVPDVLAKREERLRTVMDSFTQLHPLAIGDVAVIPRLLPHSLQHGVRVIEFQTPVYERKIVSFAQKVLTQSHWDTEEALAVMRWQDYQAPEFEACNIGGQAAEKIVDFAEFEVWRLRLAAGCSVSLPASDCYTVLSVISGELLLESQTLSAEQAVLLPALNTAVAMSAGSDCQLLLAMPR